MESEQERQPQADAAGLLRKTAASGRWMAATVATVLLATGGVVAGSSVLSPSTGGPNDPIIFLTENLQGKTIAGPSNWVASAKSGWPAVPSSTYPCLTAADATGTQTLGSGVLNGCPSGPLDANGSGALRLTPAANSWSSYLLYNKPQNTKDGIDVNFQQAQYGGNDADGISFFIKNGANTNTTPGAAGAGLGYAKVTGYGDGIPGGLIGIGLDRYGNFSDPAYVGSGPGFRPNAVVVRGPDTSAAKDGSAGFTYLTGVTLSGGNTFSSGASTRAARTRYVRVRVDPAYFATPKVYVWVSSTPGLAPVFGPA